MEIYRIVDKNKGDNCLARHIARLWLFCGFYADHLAGRLSIGMNLENAHKEACALTEEERTSQEDYRISLGEKEGNKIIYTSRSGKRYIFNFLTEEESGEEFKYQVDSQLGDQFEEIKTSPKWGKKFQSA